MLIDILNMVYHILLWSGYVHVDIACGESFVASLAIQNVNTHNIIIIAKYRQRKVSKLHLFSQLALICW